MNDATTSAPLSPIDTLRQMYRMVRSGAQLDAPAYVDALLRVAADGGDTMAIARAFEKLGYMTQLDIVGMCAGAGARVREAHAARGWKGAIRVASELGLTDVWSAAMTAHYGPSGTHASRLDASGVPTVETMAEFPRIGAAMAEAAERFEGLLGWYDRVNVGRPLRMEHVVSYSASRAYRAVGGARA